MVSILLIHLQLDFIIYEKDVFLKGNERIMIKLTGKEQEKIFLKILNTLNEAQTRWFVAREAMLLGHGGIKKICDITGLSKPTVIRGIKELKSKGTLGILYEEGRIRQPGGGRKKIEEKNPEILHILKNIVSETTANDPKSLLIWTTKSTYQISDQIKELGYSISEDTVQRRLKELEYSLQFNGKMWKGISRKEREHQFQYINSLAKKHIREGNPVISVDIKKKERRDRIKNSDKRLSPKGYSDQIHRYGLFTSSDNKTAAFGSYDIQKNNGMATVEVSRDAIEFTAESVKEWWFLFGSKQYPHAKSIMICINGSENNGLHGEEWKYYLQKISDEIQKRITVCYSPPGISKWSNVEYKTFSFVSMNRKGESLINFETVIQVINSPASKTSKKRPLFDTDNHKIEMGITDYEMTELRSEFQGTHLQWNFTIVPEKNESRDSKERVRHNNFREQVSHV